MFSISNVSVPRPRYRPGHLATAAVSFSLRARTLTLGLRVVKMNERETGAEIVSIARSAELGIMTEVRILLPCLMDASD
jgi:hypothetical protein